MFTVYGDNKFPKNGFASVRGRHADPCNAVLEAEGYDFGYIVFGTEIIAKWCCASGWWLGEDSELCPSDRVRVAESLYSLAQNTI